MGTNTYYLAYVEDATLNAALDLAAGFGMNVVRTWAFLDAAEAPGPGQVCFQYWDDEAQAPRINDGENGLVRLDRVIARAADRGLRLILTLTNNWKDFGGMPQYVQWFGMEEKDKNHFYTDRRCRDAYQEYVRRIVTRRNSITGKLYSEEPAILAWELANEPRCEGFLGAGKLLDWVDEMSRFVRTLDTNHLIAAGEEGPLCEKLLDIETIDFGTLHLYADSKEEGSDFIRKHLGAAERFDKPVLLEEYGIKDHASRNSVYAVFLQLVEDLGGLGDLVWMTGLPKSPTQPYDPDEYVIGSVDQAPAIAAHARSLLTR